MQQYDRELASCILATRNRPQFFQQAIRCFLRQTYQPSELIVVDDGEEGVASLCRGLERVRYVRLNQPTPTGAKLNIGIRHAQGTILQKLDDDDYYHPDFLRLAVTQLPAENRANCLVAWDCFLILLAGEKQVRFSGHGWKAGGSLCFSRKLWERINFREVPSAVDSWFLRDHRPQIVPVCAAEHYLVIRHGRNTWTHMHDGTPADDYFRTLPVYSKPLEALVDPLDREFYDSLVS